MNNNQIVNTVIKALNVSYEQLKSADRHRDIADARSIAVGIILTNTKTTLQSLGRQFNRHHSTIIHGRQKYEDLYKRNSVYAEKVDACLDLLK